MPKLPPHNAPEIRQQPSVEFVGKNKNIKIGDVVVTSDYVMPLVKDLRENRREVENGKMMRFFYSPFKFTITVRNEMDHVFWIDGKTVVALEDDQKNMYEAKISRSWIAPNREERFSLSFTLNEQQIKSTKKLRLHFYDLIVATDVASNIKSRQHATFDYGVKVVRQDTKAPEIDCAASNDRVASPSDIADRIGKVKPFIYGCVSEMTHSERVVYSMYIKPNQKISVQRIRAQSEVQRSCLRKALLRFRPPKVKKVVAVKCGVVKFEKPSEKIKCSNDAHCPLNMFCSQKSSPSVCKEKTINRIEPSKAKKTKKKTKKVQQFFDDE